jgi:hypothetical protein
MVAAKIGRVRGRGNALAKRSPDAVAHGVTAGDTIEAVDHDVDDPRERFVGPAGDVRQRDEGRSRSILSVPAAGCWIRRDDHLGRDRRVRGQQDLDVVHRLDEGHMRDPRSRSSPPPGGAAMCSTIGNQPEPHHRMRIPRTVHACGASIPRVLHARINGWAAGARGHRAGARDRGARVRDASTAA